MCLTILGEPISRRTHDACTFLFFNYINIRLFNEITRLFTTWVVNMSSNPNPILKNLDDIVFCIIYSETIKIHI